MLKIRVRSFPLIEMTDDPNDPAAEPCHVDRRLESPCGAGAINTRVRIGGRDRLFQSDFTIVWYGSPEAGYRDDRQESAIFQWLKERAAGT